MDREYKLIEYIHNFFNDQKKDLIIGPGDDCAVFKIDKKLLLFTVDEIMEDTHFLMKFSSPSNLASKITRASVSDIYSMGKALPKICLISAGFPSNLSDRWFKEFLMAIKKECSYFNMDLAGGNMVKADKLHIAMTVFGILKGNRIIMRSGAKPGDLLYGIGFMGNAKAGLEILMKRKRKNEVYEKYLIDSFWKPVIFKDESAIISNYATSMLDNSDGLYKSLEIISKINNVKIEVELNEKMAGKYLLKWANNSRRDWREYVINGGEDYNLIFSIRSKYKDLIEKKVPNVYQIGKIEKGNGINIKNWNGKIKNFKHF